MSEDAKQKTSSPLVCPSFWNRVCAVTLAYGGLTTLMTVELNRVWGYFGYLVGLDETGVLTIIVVSGTLGTHALRSRFFSQDEWVTMQRIVLAMTSGLAIVNSVMEPLPLTLICLMAAGLHIILPMLMHE
jgi:hypothetical protein